MEKKIDFGVRTSLITIGALVLTMSVKKYPFWVWALVGVATELFGQMLTRLILWIINRKRNENAEKET